MIGALLILLSEIAIDLGAGIIQQSSAPTPADLGVGNPSFAQSIPLGTVIGNPIGNTPVVQVTTGAINPQILAQISPSPIIQNQAIRQGVAIQQQVAIQTALAGGVQNLQSVTIRAPSGAQTTFH